MTPRKNLLLETILCVSFGVASVVTFFVTAKDSYNFFSEYNLLRLALYALFLVFFLLVIRGVPQMGIDKKSLPSWIKKMIIILPILAVVFAIINAILPSVGGLIRMSDNNIFLRPGATFRMLCQLAALGVFASLSLRFVRQKKWLAITVVVVLALVLFVMAGEEISWGQRAFQWHTTGYFAEHNKQDETNLHNLATQLFQNALFFAGFILLVVLPFIHDRLAALFRKVKALNSLVDFLPQPWMMVAFGAGLMFVDPFHATYGIHWGSIFFQLIGTLVILATVAYRLRAAGDEQWRVVARTLACALIVVVLSLSFSTLWHKNNGLPTEYIKSYTSFGILCWAISVRQRVNARRKGSVG